MAFWRLSGRLPVVISVSTPSSSDSVLVLPIQPRKSSTTSITTTPIPITPYITARLVFFAWCLMCDLSN